MGDREYRSWIIEQVLSGAYSWILFCRDETGTCRRIQVSKNTHNGLVLEKMLGKPIFVLGEIHCGYTVINMNVEAVICVWAEPAKLEVRQNFEVFVLTGSITSLRLLIVFLLKRRTKMTKKLYYLRSKSFCLLRLL